MSYTVFARKYRPQTFDEIVGQDHIVRTLKNAIEQGRLAQAYLFVGPRGTGKTSTARIFAKALNCIHAPTTNPCGVCDMCREIAAGNSLNVLEFDAASNTQVDKIREIIIDTVKFAPSSGKYKLYIVDEVHMLSTSSFNALLKTLEEPPAHVKFVFATTDVQKVPTTIISRCQRFDLRRIPAADIASHLLFIAGKEAITLSVAAAETIARGAEGGLRDAESMLDQLVAFCGEKIDESNVLEIFGFTAQRTVAALCEHLIAGDASAVLGLLHEQSEAGRDLTRLMADLISHFRNLLVIKADPNGVKDELCSESLVELAAQSERLDMDKLLTLIEQFAAAENRMKWAPNRKMHFEVAAIRAIQTLRQTTLDEVLEKLNALRGGEAPPAAPAARETRPPAAKPAAPANVPKLAVNRPATPAVPSPTPAAPDPEPAPSPSIAIRESAPTISDKLPPQNPAPGRANPESLWADLVARVRQERPLIASWVGSAALLGVDGGTATVGFPPDQWLAMESCEKPNNRKFLEALASQLAGQTLALKFVKREGLVVQPVAASEAKPAAAADPLAAFKNDPLIARALQEFKAQILPA